MLRFYGELSFGHQVLNVDVPTGTKTISITGTTIKTGFLYGYLYDAEQQLRGNVLWVKEHKKLVITADNASLGGIAGNVMAGQWQLHLYNLEGENRAPKAMQYQVDVTFECVSKADEHANLLGVATTKNLIADNSIIFDYSNIKNSASKWYRGDLHAHTLLSDGHNTLEAATNIVERQGLDFFFLTEHNICHPALPISDTTLILPGIEVTTDQGHFNVHGPCNGLNMLNTTYSSEALIKQGLSLVGEQQQGSISINHPMMKPWHWHFDSLQLSDVNTMEICCDPTWSSSPMATEKALTTLSAMWNAGHRIAGVGGSDSHLELHERNPKATEPSIYGDPSTFVFSHGLSGEGVLTGLQQGQVYIERRCGLAFSINDGNLLPGQNVGEQSVDYHLAVADKDNHYYAECIADGMVILTLPITNEGIDIHINMAHYMWVRFDIRRGVFSDYVISDCEASEVELEIESTHRQQIQKGEFEGMINPVYNGNHPHFSSPILATWGELMKEVEHNGN
ncbi:CehA/McbA family metallohydrolase [Photobacterium indicum]|uniref:CehA/McbA family metallohydrolase n=1 Tax=Photobacterium indicum TaxID=81447 RepID=UPI003D0B1F21